MNTPLTRACAWCNRLVRTPAKFCNRLCAGRFRSKKAADKAAKADPLLACRECRTCKITKNLSEFHKTGKYWRPDCRDCWNKKLPRRGPQLTAWGNYLKKKYGLSPDEYESLRSLRNGRCDICQREPKSISELHLDHDHVTGRIRGFICTNCNRGLGYFQDDQPRLIQAIAYLRLHSQGGNETAEAS